MTSKSKTDVVVDETIQSNNQINDTPIELYKNVMLEEYIYLKPVDLNNKIDDIILRKLKKKIEGKCIRVGYIKPDSVKILSRSLGIINNSNFDGVTMFKVKFTVDVCKPTNGQIVDCKVFNIDKSQVICYIDDQQSSPLEIYLFKHHHVGNVDFANLKNGDIIRMRIGGSKWEYRDEKIITIGNFISTI